jgi:hypothetical protein
VGPSPEEEGSAKQDDVDQMEKQLQEWNALPDVELPEPPRSSPAVVYAKPAPWQAALWEQLESGPLQANQAQEEEKVDSLPQQNLHRVQLEQDIRDYDAAKTKCQHGNNSHICCMGIPDSW